MKSFLDFKSIDDQITEVLSKDASAGDWISDFVKSDNPKFAGKSKEKRKEMALAAYYAKQNEAVVQPNGTDKVEPDAGMCQVCGAVDCKEHFYKSPAVTGYVKEATVDTADVNKNKNITQSDKDKLGKLAALMAKQKKPIKEESGEHHDYEHVKKTMKKVDFDTYAKHMTKHDADHSMENKHKVDTQHSGSYTGKIHGAEVSHKVSASGQKEYYIKEETLDEISKNLARKYYRKASNQAMDSLVAKDNPFAFPSTKKDHENTLNKRVAGMKAAGRRLDNRVPTSEEVDHIDEISKETLSNYVHKSFAQGNELHKQIDIETDNDKKAKLKAKLSQRNSGVIKAAQKMRNEEQEKKPYIVISHVSDNTGARADGEKVEKLRVATKLVATSPEHALQLSKAHHEKSGRKVHSASIKEEVELEEAIDTIKKDASGKVIAWSHEGDWEKMSAKKQGTGKAANLAGKALQKTKTLNKEEVELEESWEVYDTKTRVVHSSHPTQRKALNAMNKLNDKHPGYETPGDLIASKFGARLSKAVKEEVELDEAAWGKDKMTNLRQAHDRHMEKALAANKAGDDEAVKVHQRKMQMIQGKMQKLKNNEEVELGEECEILSELSKTTLKSYINKSSTDIGLRGMKAGEKKTFDKSSLDNLNKMSNRVKGIDKAADKLTKEEVEELDELDKKTLSSYVSKSHDQLMKHTGTVNMKYGRGDKDATAYALDKDALRKTANRTQGMKTALDKLTKEDTMVTYKEFMASIEEGRIDDLKDKLAADREKRLNKMDFSKEKPAAKNPVTKVKGHSYGAGDEEGEAETAKPAEPAEKRGRGRPAGSKSGARA